MFPDLGAITFLYIPSLMFVEQRLYFGHYWSLMIGLPKDNKSRSIKKTPVWIKHTTRSCDHLAYFCSKHCIILFHYLKKYQHDPTEIEGSVRVLNWIRGQRRTKTESANPNNPGVIVLWPADMITACSHLFGPWLRPQYLLLCWWNELFLHIVKNSFKSSMNWIQKFKQIMS